MLSQPFLWVHLESLSRPLGSCKRNAWKHSALSSSNNGQLNLSWLGWSTFDLSAVSCEGLPLLYFCQRWWLVCLCVEVLYKIYILIRIWHSKINLLMVLEKTWPHLVTDEKNILTVLIHDVIMLVVVDPALEVLFASAQVTEEVTGKLFLASFAFAREWFSHTVLIK